ncbi:hypothetical protein ACFLVG_03450 [Chloroflexota bacterium]
MTKYEEAKYLIKQKTRIRHKCHQCGKCIEVGEFYYKERINMRPPPSLILKEYCESCGIEREN